MSVVSNIVQNTLAQGFGKIATAIISAFGVTALLTRLLSQSDYGAYIFITSFVLLFGTTSDWGTNIIAVREASQNKEKQPIIFGSSILFRLFLSLLSLLILNLVVRVNPSWNNLVYPTTVGSLVLLVLSLKTSMTIIFQAKLRLDLTALSDLLSAVFFLALILLSSLSGFNLSIVMVDWFLATTITAFFALYFAHRISPIVWRIDWIVVKKIFWEAAPTGGLLLVFTLYNRIDIIILEHFKGSSVVATYGLAYKLHDNLVLGAAFLMNSLFPHLAKEFNKNDTLKIIKEYYQKAFDVLLVFAIVLLIFVFIFSPVIINLIAGQNYSSSSSLFRILSLGTFIAYFNHLTGYSLIAFGRQRSSLVIAVVALVFNVIGNILLTPYYSSVASAWMTVATEAFVLLLSTLVIRKTIGIFPSLFSFPQTLREFAIAYFKK